ncbi:MAG: flagellar basal body rod modification protein [Rhodobacteraceae bacterium]|nr:MAG: flagellar basal body rod modification protein [Paracoccaceae bacterium]
MINAIPTTTAQLPSPTVPEVSSNSAGIATDFDTFLKMLTAQAKYQDPLEPIDASTYSSQLAQFSMVEQQVKTNDALAALATQSSISSIGSLASWVGMEARAAAPTYFDGSPVSISANPASVSDRTELVVLDETGNEVQRIKVPVSSEPIEWAGVDDSGDPFEKGLYSFKIDSFQGEDLVLSETAEVYSTISEAQLRNGQVFLILDGGQAISSSAVTGLRNAS